MERCTPYTKVIILLEYLTQIFIFRFPSFLYFHVSLASEIINAAFAGGTGAVGRIILDVLGHSSHHQAFILTRKVLDVGSTQ